MHTIPLRVGAWLSKMYRGVSCFIIAFLVTRGTTDKPPNILFILADDLGYGDLEMYPNPNSKHGRLHTPYTKALASEGMMFTDAYAGGTVCAPSRCALMTGRHTGHCTVRENGQVLNESDVTIANILQSAGYNTTLIGKWGLGSQDYPPAMNQPNSEGFDFFFGYNSQENAHNYYPVTLYYNQGKVNNSNNVNASREKCGTPLTQYCDWAQDAFVNMTEYLLNETTEPFFLFLSFTTPHAGGIGTNEEEGVPVPYDTEQYVNQTWPQIEKDFASAVTIQDKQIGQIMDSLVQLDLYNNTVVFVASDNGAMSEGGHDYQFFESSGPLRGYKRSLHEGGVRSPLIVRWPGVVKPGTVVDQQWSFWDFMATAADIAGIPLEKLPANDGYSLLPTLNGQKQDQPKYIYHEYCSPTEDKKGWGQAVRFMNWKALRYNFNVSVELYDLVNDLGEQNDVASDRPDLVELAVQYMNEAHVSGPKCGYIPPHPND